MSKYNRETVIFDKKLNAEIVSLFDKKIDEDGYIIEKNGERVLTKEGEEIKIEDFGGLRKGSEVFIKSDIVSLIKYMENR